MTARLRRSLGYPPLWRSGAWRSSEAFSLFTYECMTTQLDPSRARGLRVAAARRKRAAFRFAGLLVAAALLVLALVIMLGLPGARVTAEKKRTERGLETIPTSDAPPQHP